MWDILLFCVRDGRWQPLLFLVVGFVIGISVVYKYFHSKRKQDIDNAKEDAQQSYAINGLKEDIDKIKERTKRIPTIKAQLEYFGEKTDRQDTDIKALIEVTKKHSRKIVETSTKLDDLVKALNGFDKQE